MRENAVLLFVVCERKWTIRGSSSSLLHSKDIWCWVFRKKLFNYASIPVASLHEGWKCIIIPNHILKMDVFSSRVRWCPNLLFRFLTKIFQLPRYTTDFWGYSAFKNSSMIAEKHVNFTVYQMRWHSIRYVATDYQRVSASSFEVFVRTYWVDYVLSQYIHV
jgi:hypothetical protein